MVRINPLAVARILQTSVQEWSTASGLRFSSDIRSVDKCFADLLMTMMVSRYENEDSMQDSLEVDENFEWDDDVESASESEEDDRPRTRTSSFSRKCSVDDEDDSGSDYSPSPHKRSHEDTKLTLIQKKAVVEYAWLQTSQRRKFSSIKSKYTWVKDWKQIYRFREQVRAGGDREDIVKEIGAAKFEKFQNAFSNGLAVHDLDIHIWAMEVAASLDHVFKACDSWVLKFKKLYGIRSRKITLRVSSVNYDNEEELQSTTRAFQEKIRLLVRDERINRQLVWNADQTGVNYETIGNRTLAFRGLKDVKNKVQNINATTHSFTAMPLINMDGIMHRKMFVTLQEQGGKFGPKVAESMMKPHNLVLSASKSGNMDKNLLAKFVSECFSSAVSSSEKNLLIVDHWKPFTDHDFIRANLPDGLDLMIENVPKNCTSRCQPLDVYGFRPFKEYLRTLSQYMKASHPEVKLMLRDNCIKMMSIVHNQLSAKRFEPLWKFSFIKAGLRPGTHKDFDTPKSFGFRFGVENCAECVALARVRCARFSRFYCLTHFFHQK